MRSIFLGLAMLPAVLIGLPSYATGADPALELVVQRGHSGGVGCMALSGDGKRLLTGSSDTTAILWDVKAATMLRTFAGHANSVRYVALSGDGKRALTSSEDTTIVWNVESGTRIRTFDNFTVKYAGLTRDGKRVLAGKDERSAVLWDVELGTKIRTFANLVGSFEDLSGDGKRMLTIEVTITEKPRFRETNDAILWDVNTGTRIRSFRLPERPATDEGSNSARGKFSGDGERVLTTWGSTAVLWNANTGAKIRSFAGDKQLVASSALSGDGERVTTTTFSLDETEVKTVLWDVKTGKKIHTFTRDDAIAPVLFSGDGKQLFGARNQGAILWDIEANTKIRNFAGHSGSLTSVALSGDGKRVLTGSEDTTANLWDVQAGTKIRTFAEHRVGVEAVALSGDGKRALTGAHDGHPILWDVEAGTPIRVFVAATKPSAENAIRSVALSVDGKRALTGSLDKTAILWDAESGTRIGTFAAEGASTFTRVALSSDGKRVLTGRTKTAILWDADAGTKLRTFAGHSAWIDSVALSGDGKRALTGAQDGTANLWDVETLTKLGTFAGHTGTVTSVALSGDGRRVVTGSNDQTAILWNGEVGIKIGTFIGHTGGVTSVALSGDGRRVFTASQDGTVGVWENERLLCQLISLDQGQDWLVITPDGLFDGSPNATRLVSYRKAGTLDFVPLERYGKHYFRSGLLAQIFQGRNIIATVPVSKALPPKVRITSPVTRDAKEGKLEVRAEAASMGEHPVKEFRLLLDGRPVGGSGGMKPVKEPKLGEVRESWTVELTPGKHTLKVLADSAYSQGASDEVEVRYVGGASSTSSTNSSSGGGSGVDAMLPRLYVFAVGISDYKDEKLRLDFAGRDAKAVADAFRTHSKPLFRSVEVKLLTDKEASRATILQGLSWLSQELTAKDYGVVYFSGHGEVDSDGSHYLLPSDVDAKDLLTTGVPKEVVKKRLLSLPGGRVMFIIDACHSGGGAPKKKSTRNLSDDLIRDLTTEESGLVVMCSSTGLESSVESNEHKMGAFTVALVEALSGKAKKNTDGAVYLTQIDAYIADRVKELTGGRQHPTTSKPDTIRSFPLSKP
jgi:WD40 repeat protein